MQDKKEYGLLLKLNDEGSLILELTKYNLENMLIAEIKNGVKYMIEKNCIKEVKDYIKFYYEPEVLERLTQEGLAI
jgi:hypothetical protein